MLLEFVSNPAAAPSSVLGAWGGASTFVWFCSSRRVEEEKKINNKYKNNKI